MESPTKEAEASAPATTTTTRTQSIMGDIWYHVSVHIAPPDVGRFALICQQTAAIVKTKRFWRNIYDVYCRHPLSPHWNLQLPPDLQPHNMRNCNAGMLRYLVIKSLFYCYLPFVERMKYGYSIDKLVGHTYVASWHYPWPHANEWMMIYKFWNNITYTATSKDLTDELESEAMVVVDDWELLAEEDADRPLAPLATNPHEGVYLLVLCYKRFIPLPTQLLYQTGRGGGTSRTLLTDISHTVGFNICISNLQLYFEDPFYRNKAIVAFPGSTKYKVIPWWHNEFDKYNKKEALNSKDFE